MYLLSLPRTLYSLVSTSLFLGLIRTGDDSPLSGWRLKVDWLLSRLSFRWFSWWRPYVSRPKLRVKVVKDRTIRTFRSLRWRYFTLSIILSTGTNLQIKSVICTLRVVPRTICVTYKLFTLNTNNLRLSRRSPIHLQIPPSVTVCWVVFHDPYSLSPSAKRWVALLLVHRSSLGPLSVQWPSLSP